MKIGESKEDYLEAAYVLKRQKGYVRNSMLSDYLNYSKASVSVAVRGLLADGYVIKDRYGSIELTEEARIGTEDEGREYVKRRNEINELNQKQERRWRDFTVFSALKMK